MINCCTIIRRTVLEEIRDKVLHKSSDVYMPLWTKVREIYPILHSKLNDYEFE